MVNLMKEKYRNKIMETNSWIDNTYEYGLILTDDLDSLLGCAILKAVKGWNIEQIMLFKADKNRRYDYLGATANNTHEVIGVDLALMNGKCFDNHLTAFSYGQKPNPESINLNNVCNICRNSYCSKYNTSTVILLWSLYDLPKEKLPDELMMLLLSIDGTHDAYYLYQGNFRGTLRKWLVDVLDLPEFYDCFERHTYSDFEDIRKKYVFHPKKSTGHGKIVMEHGFIDTAIDIDGINDLLAWECDVQIKLPTEKFYKKAVFQDLIKDVRALHPTSIESITDGEIYSYALTGENLVNYSKKIES